MKNDQIKNGLRRVLSVVLLLLMCSFFMSCEEEDEDDDRATMCYEVSGNYLTVNCMYNSSGSCESENKNSLGNYDTWQACYNDMSDVVDNYAATGNISPGPNSNGGGGGSGDGGGGSSANCDLAYYNGPEFDIQVDSQCKAAFVYDCVGEIEARNASCDLYYEYGNAVWTGPGSLPDCPYCN